MYEPTFATVFLKPPNHKIHQHHHGVIATIHYNLSQNPKPPTRPLKTGVASASTPYQQWKS